MEDDEDKKKKTLGNRLIVFVVRLEGLTRGYCDDVDK